MWNNGKWQLKNEITIKKWIIFDKSLCTMKWYVFGRAPYSVLVCTLDIYIDITLIVQY